VGAERLRSERQVPRDRREGYARVVAISTCAGPIGESMVPVPQDHHVNLIAPWTGVRWNATPFAGGLADEGRRNQRSAGGPAEAMRCLPVGTRTGGIGGSFYEPRPSRVAIPAVFIESVS
jgi:hypothetical protein